MITSVPVRSVPAWTKARSSSSTKPMWTSSTYMTSTCAACSG
jgi:hypothetical protein